MQAELLTAFWNGILWGLFLIVHKDWAASKFTQPRVHWPAAFQGKLMAVLLEGSLLWPTPETAFPKHNNAPRGHAGHFPVVPFGKCQGGRSRTSSSRRAQLQVPWKEKATAWPHISPQRYKTSSEDPSRQEPEPGIPSYLEADGYIPAEADASPLILSCSPQGSGRKGSEWLIRPVGVGRETIS